MPNTTQDKRLVWDENYDGTFGSPYPNGDKPEGYLHGQLITITDTGFGANSFTKKSFIGGIDGIIETTTLSATIAETTDWKFTVGAHNPITSSDVIRGKVMDNDYFAQADLNATHTFVFGSGVGYDTNIYFSRWIKPIVETTGDIDYPVDTETLQLKLPRLNTAYDVVDTNDNTGMEAAFFRGWGSQSSVLRLETGDGLITGTATSGNSTTLNDTSKSWGTNTLKNRGLQLTGGTGAGQFGLITSNTGTSIDTQYGFSPAPDDTTTYEIQSATVYAASDDVDVNQGWQREETHIRTNSNGVANGTLKRIIYKSDGAHVTLNKTDLTFKVGSSLLNYLHFQNYFGSNNVAMTLRKFLSDDLYVQIGATDNKHLVVSNNTNLSLASIMEEQDTSTWTTGNLQFKFNRGGISNSGGTYYLCSVINGNTVEYSIPFNVGGIV